MLRALVSLVAAGLILTACGEKQPTAEPDRLILERVGFADLPGWSDDDPSAALVAFARTCARWAALPQDRSLGAGGIAGTVGDWHSVCTEAEAVPRGNAEAARRFFETRFQPFAATADGEEAGLFTGYYEPELHGSRTKSDEFRVPLYRRPPDLVMVDLGLFRENLKGERIAGRVVEGSLRPYESRGEIEDGALDGRDLELFWVDDAIDAFFLHIQGSGRVKLAEGGVARVGYAGQNGHPYFAIGRDLIERGELSREEVSLQSIRAWMKAHPEEGAALMRKNPSYVFFQEIDGEGPIGAQGVPLEPGRSLAVDRRFVPLGTPVWLVADPPNEQSTPIRRLLIAQDTGGAIKGPVRGDVFWGAGDEAAELAGPMKSQGRYYLLLPRGLAARQPGA